MSDPPLGSRFFKMLVSDFYKVPVQVSLAVVLTLLAGAAILSLIRRAGNPARG